VAAILLQAPDNGGFGMAMIIQFVLIIGVVYFLFILPQRREQKKHREMLAALRPGDEVATAGGLVGEIVQLKDEVVTIKSGDARVVVERGRVAHLVNARPAAK
jgi:preprotein translocase subunit YajC